MSLFIGGLAFEHASFEAPIRLGVLVGSIASAVVGFANKPNARGGPGEDQAAAPQTQIC